MPPMPPALDMRVHAHCRHTPRHTPQKSRVRRPQYVPTVPQPIGQGNKLPARASPGGDSCGEGRSGGGSGDRGEVEEEEEEVEAAPTAERRRAGACGAHPLGRGRWKGAIGDDRAASNLCAPTRPMARLPPPSGNAKMRSTPSHCDGVERQARVSRRPLRAPRSALRASLGRLKRSGCRRMPAALAQAGKHRREEASPRHFPTCK
jgi:hypothetical protein